MEVAALAVILFAALAFQNWLFNRFAFSSLEYRCAFSTDEAHEGDSLFLVETVHNRKLLPVPWLKVDIHSSRWLDFAGTCSVVAQDSRRVTSSFILKGYQKTVRRWKLKCLKRGVFTTENVTLVSGDLLNFGVVSIPVRVDASLVVYPEVIDLEELFTPANYLQSDHIVKRWIVDDPFIVSGVREYTSGDPTNRIHWPATAKEGRLMVKKNDFTSQFSLTVLLNTQSMLYERDYAVYKNLIELGIKVAATLFDRALLAGSPVRFGSNGCTPDSSAQTIFTGEAADKEHIGGLLRILASLVLKSVKDFEIFLEDKIAEIENSEVIIVTSYLSEGLYGQIKRLESGMNTIRVVLLDPFCEERALPGDIDIRIMTRDHAANILAGEEYK